MANKEPTTGSKSLTINRLDAPEIFASGVLRIDGAGPGVIKLTFCTLSHNLADPGQIDQVVNLRLVMPEAAAQNMVDYVGAALRNAQIAAAPLPPGTPVQ